MKIRSTRSFNAIPATVIRGVFNLYISNLLFKMYCKYSIYSFHLFLAFFFNYCKLFLVANLNIHTYIHWIRVIALSCNFCKLLSLVAER